MASVGGRSGRPRGLRPPGRGRGGCCEEAARAGPGSWSGWGGGGAESPCNPGPTLAPPPPGGAPAAATQSRTSGAEGGGRGRGKFEITPEPPLRSSSTGAASRPPGRLNHPRDNRPSRGPRRRPPTLKTPPRARLPRPHSDHGHRRAGLDAGAQRRKSPHRSHTAAGSPLYPHSSRSATWALRCPRGSVIPLWTLGLVLPPSLLPRWPFVGHLEGRGGRAEERRQVPGWVLGYSWHHSKEKPQSVRGLDGLCP